MYSKYDTYGTLPIIRDAGWVENKRDVVKAVPHHYLIHNTSQEKPTYFILQLFLKEYLLNNFIMRLFTPTNEQRTATML
jgi:hypothetical protein